jgi:metal-dependent amidase/aminoacylase/carboxypeptidase family protein
MPDNRSSVLLEIAARAVKTRRDLHRFPELEMIEFLTASIVAERLTALGLEIKTRPRGDGFGEPDGTIVLA